MLGLYLVTLPQFTMCTSPSYKIFTTSTTDGSQSYTNMHSEKLLWAVQPFRENTRDLYRAVRVVPPLIFCPPNSARCATKCDRFAILKSYTVPSWSGNALQTYSASFAGAHPWYLGTKPIQPLKSSLQQSSRTEIDVTTSWNSTHTLTFT